MSKHPVRREIIETLPYDAERNSDHLRQMRERSSSPAAGTALLIYENSDIDSAVQHLAVSMLNPYRKSNFISSVYVEEAIREKFISKLSSKLMSPVCLADEHRQELEQSFKSVQETIAKLKAYIPVSGKTISKESSLDIYPMLVSDFCHKDLLESVNTLGCIVTFHTFRHDEELRDLLAREDSIMVRNLSIWQANYCRAYSIVLTTNSEFCLINCYGDFNSLKFHNLQCNQVFIENNYHYECLQSNAMKKKRIVFPISNVGSHAN